MSLKLSIPTRYRIAVGSFFFSQGLVFSSWAGRIPDIKKALNQSDGEWGTIIILAPIGQVLAMALSGYLVTRFGSRFCLRIAVLAYPLLLICLGGAGNVYHLMAALFIFGMTGNLHNISVNTQAVGVERLHEGSILASFHGMWSVAGFLGGVISTWMMNRGIIPLHHFELIFGVVFLISLIMGPSLLPRDQKPPSRPGPGRRFVKPDRYIVLLGGIAFGSMICEGAMMNWSGLYFENVVKAEREWVGMGYVAFMATMVCGRFMADKLAKYFSFETIFRISGVITVLGFSLTVLFPYLATSIIGFLMVGLGVSSVVPLCYSLAGKSKTMHPGVAVASISTLGFLGFLVSPTLIGWVAEISSLRWSFAVIACIGLSTIFLVPKLQALRKTM